ncbi:MAG TPA: molybdate ABC transporter substrate-binding protein [Pseudomonadales bacterium]|nr:molybdate ABC transporter substrate-binding protein [Pseudomonadales bacterium]
MGKFWLTLVLCFVSLESQANSRLLVAVASNFEPTARALIASFNQQQPSINIALSSAASGTHFHQIINGAPYDIFLSADTHFPQKLHAAGYAGEIRGYARGKLVLTSKLPFEYQQAIQDIALGKARLAIANPNTAPYGLAAQQVLSNEHISITPIQGQNVGQALNFLTSGAVDFAFASLSQVLHRHDIYWQLAPAVHDPIDQAAILLAMNNADAQTFWQFLSSREATAIIVAHGYEEASVD